MAEWDESVSPICPYLGLPDDPATHYSVPEGAHRCHARRKPAPIDLAYQAEFCTGGRYQQCRYFKRAARAPGPVSRGRPGWRVLAGAAALVVAIIAAVLAVALGRAIVDEPPGAIAEPTGSPVALATEQPPPAPVTPAPVPPASAPPSPPTFSPTPPATPTAQPSATAVPTSAPTAQPTPQPTPIIHVVQLDETIWYIAQLYGVTPRAIVQANNLPDRNYIQVGQRLIIPPPEPQP